MYRAWGGRESVGCTYGFTVARPRAEVRSPYGSNTHTHKSQ
mgnify:CR=1 FL=1